MTRLVGVYDPRASDQVLDRVAERMCRAAALRLRSWTVGGGSDVARCGVFHRDGRDDVARGRDIWLVFEGEWRVPAHGCTSTAMAMPAVASSG